MATGQGFVADTAGHRGTPESPAAYSRNPGGSSNMSRGLSAQSSAQGSSKGAAANGQGNGAAAEVQMPSLEVRVVTMERGRRDLTMRFQARTNLSQFRQTVYPSIMRTYREITLLCLALTLQHQNTIVQALPIPFPTLVSANQSAPSSRTAGENAAMQHQEDIFLAQVQRWFNRVTADPVLLQAPELRAWIESEYSYHPTPPDPSTSSPALRKRFSAGIAALQSAGVSGSYGPVDVGSSVLGLPSGAGTSGGGATAAAKSLASSFFSFTGGSSSGSGALGFATSRSVHDEDDELVGAREEVTRLEMQFAQAAETLDKLSNQRRAQLGATGNLSARMTSLAAVEEVRPPSAKLGLPHALGCTGEMLRRVTDLEEGQSRMEIMTLGDMLAYQSLNARSAKEAMLSRNALVEEQFHVAKLVATRKQTAENLRGAANLRPERVDEALQDYQDAREREREIAIQLQGVSQGLKGSLRRHSKFAHADLEEAIVAHGKESLRRARIMLDVVRGLRPEIRRVPEPLQQAPVAPIASSQDLNTSSFAGARLPSGSTQPSPALRSNGMPAANPFASMSRGPSQQVVPPGRAAQPQLPDAAAAQAAPTSPPLAQGAATPRKHRATSVSLDQEAGEAPMPAPSSDEPSQHSAPAPAPAEAAPAPSVPATPEQQVPPRQEQARASPFASLEASRAASASGMPSPGFMPRGNASSMARSMFSERPSQPASPGAGASGAVPGPNPFGNGASFGSASVHAGANGGGLNSGRSRISARDAAKSLAGKF